MQSTNAHRITTYTAQVDEVRVWQVVAYAFEKLCRGDCLRAWDVLACCQHWTLKFPRDVSRVAEYLIYMQVVDTLCKINGYRLDTRYIDLFLNGYLPNVVRNRNDAFVE
jgi:hypothetical protein